MAMLRFASGHILARFLQQNHLNELERKRARVMFICHTCLQVVTKCRKYSAPWDLELGGTNLFFIIRDLRSRITGPICDMFQLYRFDRITSLS